MSLTKMAQDGAPTDAAVGQANVKIMEVVIRRTELCDNFDFQTLWDLVSNDPMRPKSLYRAIGAQHTKLGMMPPFPARYPYHSHAHMGLAFTDVLRLMWGPLMNAYFKNLWRDVLPEECTILCRKFTVNGGIQRKFKIYIEYLLSQEMHPNEVIELEITDWEQKPFLHHKTSRGTPFKTLAWDGLARYALTEMDCDTFEDVLALSKGISTKLSGSVQSHKSQINLMNSEIYWQAHSTITVMPLNSFSHNAAPILLRLNAWWATHHANNNVTKTSFCLAGPPGKGKTWLIKAWLADKLGRDDLPARGCVISLDEDLKQRVHGSGCIIFDDYPILFKAEDFDNRAELLINILTVEEPRSWKMRYTNYTMEANVPKIFITNREIGSYFHSLYPGNEAIRRRLTVFVMPQMHPALF